jgi:hypothetical protein
MRKMNETKMPGRICLASMLLAAAFGCSASTSAKTDSDSKVLAAVKPPVAARIVIPSGTVLHLSLIDTLDTTQSAAGDSFKGSLSEAVVINGTTLLAKGTLVHGRVVDAQGSKKVKGRAKIRLELTDLIHANKVVVITTDTFAAEAKSTEGRDAAVIAGGAGLGAVIGAIAGGKKGAGIGAIAGGGGGTGVVLATKGEEIHYGPETHLNFTLTNAVNL